MWPFAPAPPNFADTFCWIVLWVFIYQLIGQLLVYTVFYVIDKLEGWQKSRKRLARLRKAQKEQNDERIARQKALDDLAHG